MIKFLTKISKSNNEIIEMLTAGYGDNTLQRSIVCEWAKRFQEGRVLVDDNPREGRPVSLLGIVLPIHTRSNVSRCYHCSRQLTMFLSLGIAFLSKFLHRSDFKNS